MRHPLRVKSKNKKKVEFLVLMNILKEILVVLEAEFFKGP